MAPARFESVCEGGEQIRYGRLRLRLPGHQGRSLIGASWSSMTSGLFKQGSKRLPGSTLPPCQHAQDGNDEQRRPDHLPAGESGELSIPSGWRQITSTATLMRITTSDSRLRTGLRPRSTPPHSPPKAVRIGTIRCFFSGLTCARRSQVRRDDQYPQARAAKVRDAGSSARNAPGVCFGTHQDRRRDSRRSPRRHAHRCDPCAYSFDDRRRAALAEGSPLGNRSRFCTEIGASLANLYHWAWSLSPSPPRPVIAASLAVGSGQQR